MSKRTFTMLVAAVLAVAGLALVGLFAYAESRRAYNSGHYNATKGGEIVDNPNRYDPWGHIWWERGFRDAVREKKDY